MGVLRLRKMFGGVYVYCDDLFIATIHDETLYFKANASTAAEFVARGLPLFSYPKDGGIATLQYYQAPPEVFTGKTAMRHWAAKALLAAQQDSVSKPRAPKAKRRDAYPSIEGMPKRLRLLGIPHVKRVCRAWHESSRVKVPVPGL
jgi:DNA transformation protein